MKSDKVLILSGTLLFSHWETERQTIRAIIRQSSGINEFVFEFEDDGRYTANLKHIYNNEYKGSYLYNGKTYTEEVNAKMFWHMDELQLVGKWLEDGDWYSWSASLEIIDIESTECL